MFSRSFIGGHLGKGVVWRKQVYSGNCHTTFPIWIRIKKTPNQSSGTDIQRLHCLDNKTQNRDESSQSCSVTWVDLESVTSQANFFYFVIFSWKKYGSEKITHMNIDCLSSYHRFRWYATLENKTLAETFLKFPSVFRVIDRSDRNPPITAWYDVEEVRRSH